MKFKQYKGRIYPNESQIILLHKTFGCARLIWNIDLQHFNDYKNPNRGDRETIKELKDRLPFLKEVPYNALEQKKQDFDQTIKQVFNKKRKKKIGKPKFKSKKDKQSIRFSINGFSFKDNNKIHLSKIGQVKIKGFDLESIDLQTCKSVTISCNRLGEFFISILVQEEFQSLPLTGKSVGIDLGLTDFCTLSNGEKIQNPRFMKLEDEKIKKAHRDLSRKVKGSARYEKQRIKLQKLYRDISNRRENFLHQESIRLVREYDNIYVENLEIQEMMKNRRLQGSIQDVSWARFISMIEYKSDWYGREFLKVGRYFASTQICSCCSSKTGPKDLSVREWVCQVCSVEHDRDENAQKNILKEGFRLSQGLNSRQSTPT